MTGRDPDHLLVRRAARGIATQTAAAVTVVLAIVTVTVYLVQVQSLHRSTESAVRSAARAAVDLDDAPTGVVLLHRQGADVQLSPGAPSAFAVLRSEELPVGLIERRLGDRRYEIFTEKRPDGFWSAALDLRRRSEETDRLLETLVLTGGFGVAGAALVGAAVGRRAMRPASAALALQRRFVADASHELRTPLTIVHTRAQLLRERLAEAPPATRQQLDQLVADTRALGEVVEDLLLSAQLSPRPETADPVDLAAVVTEVIASFEVLAAGRGVRLTAHLAPGTPTVRASGTALRRALSALVDNALGHVAPGGAVDVDLESTGREVTLRVRDDGDGFDPGTGADLLGRFARGTSASEGRRFGLGLALVNEVVVAHGGRLTLTGAPGDGATATIVLPTG